MAVQSPDEEAIFHVARKIESLDARCSYLQQVCCGDPSLCERIQALLIAHEQDRGFLESDAGTKGAAAPNIAGEGPGSLIGQYKLLEQIGEGGFGVIFMAEQLHPVRRKVAVKLIKPGMDSQRVLARFEVERQALARMEHPNIAHVLDAGTTPAGRPYFVMELVRGVPLIRFCDDSRLPVNDRLRLFMDVCRAVQHAHQKGIIHRDLKPGNILVTLHDGIPVPKVIDFGIAKALGEPLTDRTLFTGFAQLLGTPSYMSPEQAEMSGLGVDTRSDIYALGVILYELITGATPFDAERLQTAGLDEVRRIICKEESAPPSTRIVAMGGQATTVSANRRTDPHKLSRLCRGELDWIVLKALEKDRNRRYDTASAFAADVQRYLNNDTVVACPPSRWYRLRKTVHRNRTLVLVCSLVALALLTGTVAATWGLIRSTDAEAAARAEAFQKEEALRDKERALTAAQLSERTARDQTFYSLLNEARAVRLTGRMGQRFGSLDAIARASQLRSDSRLRDEAIAAMAHSDLRPGPRWRALPTGYTHLDFDADYRTYARVADDGEICIRTVEGDHEVRSIRAQPMRTRRFQISPDGRYFARLETGDRLRVWRIADGNEVLPKPLPKVAAWAFSGDSRHLVVVRPGAAERLDLETGRQLDRWKLPGAFKPWIVAFHPDHRQVAISYVDAEFVSIYDSEKGAQVAELPVGNGSFKVVAWHPDGARLAISDTRFIEIWDVDARCKRATLEGHVQQVAALSFHPEGRLLASHSWDGVLRLWDVATGRSHLQMSLLIVPRFSRDGRWVGMLQHGEEAQLLEATTAPEYRTLGDGQSDHFEGEISPDDRLLAISRSRDSVCICDLTTARQIATTRAGLPVFRPDGRELLTSSEVGLERRTISFDGELKLGPPRTVPLYAVPTRVSRSQDGRTLAFLCESKGVAWLMDVDTNTVRDARLHHWGAGYIAISPDGNWVATSGWHADEVRLWNARTGEMVKEWPLYRTSVAFTPDSRTLVLGLGDEFRFHDVKTKELVLRIRRDVLMHPGYITFAPKVGLMALEMAPGIVHLKEIANGHTVARLEDPHGDGAAWMGLTSDAGRLAVVAPYAKAVHIWDIRAIRKQLRTLNLDWDEADPTVHTNRITPP
jgi:serine/threonine protein kinase/WD40 repeat protein